MAKKLTIDFIRDDINKFGFELISDKYINSKTKLKIKCPKGHIYKTIWNVWQRGFRCPICSNNRKKSFEEVKNIFEQNGYKLLSKKYKSIKDKLEILCPNNKKHKMRLNDFLNGHRCSCFAKNTKKTYIEAKASFEKEGYILLSKQYRNSYKQKLKYRCPNGHEHSIKYAEWNAGKRCPYCSGNAKPKIEEIKTYFTNEGFILFENKYINGRQKLHYKCPNGHFGTISYFSWKQGCRCSQCHYENMIGENHPNWKNYSEEDIEEKEKYRTVVDILTSRNYIKYFYLINPSGLPRNNKYHLDHIYSVANGFENNIHPKIISSPINLRIISKRRNMNKSYYSLYTKEELYFLYNQFNKETRGLHVHKFSNFPR